MEYNKDIALIFFSRTSVDEAKYKFWFKGKTKNLHAASLLINKAESSIQKSGIPVYHFHEQNQKGDTFGERIANAYQEVFDMGYEQVISVGNDCPDLEHINWKQISINLSKGNQFWALTPEEELTLLEFSENILIKVNSKPLAGKKHSVPRTLFAV